MNWNDHSKLVGLHAFLGASKYHWINYDAARLAETYASYQAKENGTRLPSVSTPKLQSACLVQISMVILSLLSPSPARWLSKRQLH